MLWSVRHKLRSSRALRIVTAARDEFARHGFDGARVDQIARRAGVNKQLLFYYFHSKRGLFDAVPPSGPPEFEEALAQPGSGAGRPLDLLRAPSEPSFAWSPTTSD